MVLASRSHCIGVISFTVTIILTLSGSLHGEEKYRGNASVFMYRNINDVIITWTTRFSCLSSVQYGLNVSDLNTTVANQVVINNNLTIRYLHYVILERLQSGRVYSYRLQCNTTVYGTRHFSTLTDDQGSSTRLLLIDKPSRLLDRTTLEAINDEVTKHPRNTLIHTGLHRLNNQKAFHEIASCLGKSQETGSLPIILPYDFIDIVNRKSHFSPTSGFDFRLSHIISLQATDDIIQQARNLSHSITHDHPTNVSWFILYIDVTVNCGSRDTLDKKINSIKESISDGNMTLDIIIIHQICGDGGANDSMLVGVSGQKRLITNMTGPLHQTLDNWTSFSVTDLNQSYSLIDIINSTHAHWQQISSSGKQILVDVWLTGGLLMKEERESNSNDLRMNTQTTLQDETVTQPQMTKSNTKLPQSTQSSFKDNLITIKHDVPSSYTTQNSPLFSKLTNTLPSRTENKQLPQTTKTQTSQENINRTPLSTSVKPLAISASTLSTFTRHPVYSSVDDVRWRNMSGLRSMTKAVLELIRSTKLQTTVSTLTERARGEQEIVLPNDRMVVQILSSHGASPNLSGVSKTTAVAIVTVLSVVFFLALGCLWRRCKKSDRHHPHSLLRYREDYVSNFYQPLANPKIDPDYDSTFTGVSIPLLQEATKV